MRRNTGEVVLTTEQEVGHGHIEGRPNIHNASGSIYAAGSSCYAQLPKPGQPAPGHKVRTYIKGEYGEADCKCRCHTRKGLREFKAESAAFAKKASDPAQQRYTFEGGASMGVNLARRVRRVSADKARRLRALDARIAKLQRDRTAIIPTTWGDGEVMSPVDLAKLAAIPADRRGPSRRALEGILESKNAISPEGKPR